MTRLFSRVLPILVAVGLLIAVGLGPASAQSDAVVRLVYFYRDDCPHCMVILDEVLEPLQREQGDRLQVKMVQVHDPDQPGEIDADKYAMLIATEDMLGVAAEDRGFPTVVLGKEVLIGEDEVRQQLSCLIDSCFASGGTDWPEIPGLNSIPLEGGGGGSALFEPESSSSGQCDLELDDVCAAPPPVWAAYVFQVGCRECSRAESDLQFVRSQYPQLIVEELNIYEHTDVAQHLARQAGRLDDIAAPAVFIGTDALIGPSEITPQALASLVEKYAATGAAKTWDEASIGELPRPSLPNLLTVVVAGLVDGLNPCAFATLIFLVSYLSAVGRRGRALLLVGGLFTLGVFAAYMLVGLGLWRALSSIPAIAQARVGPWLYGATAVICLVLAVGSLLDFLKARRGELRDMALVMPERIRRRINAVVRRSSTARAFAGAALPAGMVVSLLELACTGQVYLPTIVYVMSVPEMQARAVGMLVLYNLMFVVPLTVVFGLVYFGATSLQLGSVLRRRAASVKLATAVLFVALAIWLVVSIVF